MKRGQERKSGNKIIPNNAPIFKLATKWQHMHKLQQQCSNKRPKTPYKAKAANKASYSCNFVVSKNSASTVLKVGGVQHIEQPKL